MLESVVTAESVDTQAALRSCPYLLRKVASLRDTMPPECSLSISTSLVILLCVKNYNQQKEVLHVPLALKDVIQCVKNKELGIFSIFLPTL